MSAPAQPPAEGAEGAAPGGGPPGPPPNLTSNRRLQQTQAQVEEVVDIMRVNVDKVLERDQKLSELDDRADALQAGASQFESSAAKLKRKYWWKNCKMMIMLGVICAIIVVVISTFLLENVPPLPCSPSPSKLMFFSLLFVLSTHAFTHSLHPSPGFPTTHPSFSIAVICMTSLGM
ncbi:vesicle-associated membrane protein 1 isoform X2 [Erinaceus europaeus]|uniref:Vesicle-associated membrane protein 1 isoform X2 n=1 Tax=Erinaceus europaeus TaxID=9365 RepID=A0A1S3WHK0_ERIEU|nr:vesicle-associated membrane protein 1 isoform X2 [Erinaceus europaeus]